MKISTCTLWGTAALALVLDWSAVPTAATAGTEPAAAKTADAPAVKSPTPREEAFAVLAATLSADTTATPAPRPIVPQSRATPPAGNAPPGLAPPPLPDSAGATEAAAGALIDLHSADAAAPRSAGEGPLHDPTQAGPAFRELLGKKGQPVEMPPVQLRGRIVSAGQEPIVYLGIDSGVYSVRLGDEFNPTGKYSGLTFHVTTVNDHEVRIEVSPLHRTLILR